MPDDKSVGVTIDEYKKDQDEFNEATDLILEADPEKSDEEIAKELDEKLGTETDTAGEATKDQSTKPDDKPKPANEDVFSDGQDEGAAGDEKPAVDPDKPATDPDEPVPDDIVKLKERVVDLEAQLKKEQQKTSSWDGRIKAANTKATDLAAENEQLKLQLAKQLDPDSQTDQEKIEKFKEDFPELAEVMDVYDKRSKPVPAKVPEVVPGNDDETDSGQSTAGDESVNKPNSHLNKIHEVHSDLPEMVNTGVLLSWIQKQKPFIKSHLEDIYYKGKSAQVIDLCSQFKESSGWKSQLDNQNSDKELTKQQKLDNLKEVNSETGGAPTDGPDMNNFDQGAKDAGL